MKELIDEAVLRQEMSKTISKALYYFIAQGGDPEKAIAEIKRVVSETLIGVWGEMDEKGLLVMLYEQHIAYIGMKEPRISNRVKELLMNNKMLGV